MKVIMDTNFLMLPLQFRVNVPGEIARLLDVSYELLVPDKVLIELRTLAKKGGLNERRAARIGLELARGMKEIKLSGENTDDAILSAVDTETIVCTNDKELKERSLEKGGRVIYLKQRRFLALAGGEVGLS